MSKRKGQKVCAACIAWQNMLITLPRSVRIGYHTKCQKHRKKYETVIKEVF